MYGPIREQYEQNRRLLRRRKLISAVVLILLLALTVWWLFEGEKGEEPNNCYYLFQNSEVFFDSLPKDHTLQRFACDNFSILESCVLYDGDENPLEYTAVIEIFLDVQDLEMVHYSIHSVLDFDPQTQEKSALGYAASRPGTYPPETLQSTEILGTSVLFREWQTLEGKFEGYQALMLLDDIYVIVSRDSDVNTLFSFVEGMLA